MHPDTKAYNAALAPADRKVADLLAREIDLALPEAENKVWHAQQVDTKALARWLKQAREIQWDYKNIVRRKGQLERLK